MRPVILGMNHPGGGEPMDPCGVTGKRLIEIIGRDAFDAFDRENLLKQKLWRKFEARKACSEVRSRMSGRTVMVLGNEVWSAMSLPKAAWLGCTNTMELGFKKTTWWRVPHPSGKNLFYNDQEKRDKVRKLFCAVAKVGD